MLLKKESAMNKNATRLFRDTGINSVEGKGGAGAIFLPDKLEPLVSDRNTLLSPLTGPMMQRPSIDERIKAALKPVVRDISVLKPDKYYSLSKGAHEALCKQIRNEKSDEVREILADLIRLLKENISLTSVFRQNLNNIKKA